MPYLTEREHENLTFAAGRFGLIRDIATAGLEGIDTYDKVEKARNALNDVRIALEASGVSGMANLSYTLAERITMLANNYTNCLNTLDTCQKSVSLIQDICDEKAKKILVLEKRARLINQAIRDCAEDTVIIKIKAINAGEYDDE